MGLTQRVLTRYLQAKEFPSDKALRQYLVEHPDADRSNHTVVKKPAIKPSAIGHAGFEQRLKEALKKFPGEASKFLKDEDHRKGVLRAAVTKIKSAPRALVSNALKHAQKEINLYRSAGGAIKSILTGKKITPEQKEALHTTAKTIAIEVTLAVLTSGSSGLVGKTAHGLVTAMAKRVAINTLTVEGIGDIHSDLEWLRDAIKAGRDTAGILAEFFKMAKENEPLAPMEILGLVIAARVAKELEGLSLEDILDSLDNGS